MKRTIWLLLLFLIGCHAGGPTDEAPEIAYGRDVCDACNMIIDEARFAASYVTTTGEVRKFESIEDMVSYHHDHEEAVHIFWVGCSRPRTKLTPTAWPMSGTALSSPSPS